MPLSFHFCSFDIRKDRGMSGNNSKIYVGLFFDVSANSKEHAVRQLRLKYNTVSQRQIFRSFFQYKMNRRKVAASDMDEWIGEKIIPLCRRRGVRLVSLRPMSVWLREG